MLNRAEYLTYPQLDARRLWEQVDHTEIGEPFPLITTPWRMSGSPYTSGRPAPCLGEHNDLIYRGIVGLSDEEYTAYRDAGIISTEPLW